MAVPAASKGDGEGAVVIRVFGEITVQSASERGKEACSVGRGQRGWRARGGSGGEDGGERRGGKARLQLPSEHLPRAFTHPASETTVAEIACCQWRVTVRCTVGVLFVAAVLFGVRLAVAVGYGLGSAPGQDPGP